MVRIAARIAAAEHNRRAVPVAYLVVSDGPPERVARLAARLRAGSPGSAIGVHHDDSHGSLELPRLRELGVDVLDASSAPAGSPAEMMMLVRCLRVMLASARFDWLVLLSADEYPVRPLAEIERSLTALDVDAVMERHACPRPERGRAAAAAEVPEAALRYHYRWSKMSGPAGPAARGLAAVMGTRATTLTRPDGTWMGVPAKRSPFAAPKRLVVPPIRRNPLADTRARTPFGEGLTCFYGPWRCALTRAAVAAVDASLRDHPELALYYRDTLDPAESYLATVIGNDAALTVGEDDRRRLRAPAPIGAAQLDSVLASGADFAGPFEAEALDALDARVNA
jgi:hypothetical protein